MVEYANMAALDGLRDKTDPIGAKMVGNEDQQRQMAVKRLEIREIVGGKLMREITLKKFHSTVGAAFLEIPEGGTALSGLLSSFQPPQTFSFSNRRRLRGSRL